MTRRPDCAYAAGSEAREHRRLHAIEKCEIERRNDLRKALWNEIPRALATALARAERSEADT